MTVRQHKQPILADISISISSLIYFQGILFSSWDNHDNSHRKMFNKTDCKYITSIRTVYTHSAFSNPCLYSRSNNIVPHERKYMSNMNRNPAVDIATKEKQDFSLFLLALVLLITLHRLKYLFIDHVV